MKTKLTYLVFFILFALLGFSREFFFVNVNNQLYKLYYHHDDVVIPPSLSFITHFDYQTLYYLKFPFTIAYFLAYFLVSYFAVKLLCHEKKYAKWIIYIYSLLLGLAFITMLYNYVINNQLDGEEYTFSRWLMGIAQSPLVAFFIIASSKLYQKLQTEHIK